MKRPAPPIRFAGAAVPLALALAALLAAAASPPHSQQRLSAEIERWGRYVRDNGSKEPVWLQVKESGGAGIERARQALKAGRPQLALHRLASARTYLAGWQWVEALPARDSAAFEAQWRKLGSELEAAPSARALDGLKPAAVRAQGEAGLPQARGYYDASLEYGRNTMADFGLLYLG